VKAQSVAVFFIPYGFKIRRVYGDYRIGGTGCLQGLRVRHGMRQRLILSDVTVPAEHTMFIQHIAGHNISIAAAIDSQSLAELLS
jgi:hypothetical protein